MTRKQTESRPTVERVTHDLRQRIIHGRYAPGAFLPSERALAAELGVSRMSVSRALERLAREGIVEQHVGAGTRVTADAAKRLPPGGIAILHFVFKGSPLPEPALILQGAIDALAGQKISYEMIPVVPDGYAGPVEKAVLAEETVQLAKRFGALLFIEALAPKELLELQRMKVPVVVANLESKLDVTATWVDHRRIARSSVEILASLGHRRIGLVATAPQRAFYAETIEGYKDALKRLGLSAADNLISLCDTSNSLAAYAAAKRLLHGEDRPTAIVAGRDLHAEGVCRAAAEMDLAIGRDLSVIGFDNVTWPQNPPLLTTFEEPCYELGAEAARMLIERMQENSGKVEKREITASLIMRRSAGPPACDTPDSRDISVRMRTS